MTGNDLKRLRQQLGITQMQLAELLGYATNVHIFRLEARGRRKLPAGAEARVKAAGLKPSSSLRER